MNTLVALVFSVLSALALWSVGGGGRYGWLILLWLYPTLVLLTLSAYRSEKRTLPYIRELMFLGIIFSTNHLRQALMGTPVAGTSVPLGVPFPAIGLVGFMAIGASLLFDKTPKPLPGSAPQRYSLWLAAAAVVALVAMGGSLYFSEIRKFPPCPLCWIQRIMMYPLAIILTLAFFKKDHWIGFYAFPMAVFGAGVATYHILEERGIVETLAICVQDIPCTVKWIDWFGWITIPVLSLTGFLLILIFLWTHWQRERPRSA
ncbi:MAG: disulfide oxidoreductase [Deinococcaceae bacterium]